MQFQWRKVPADSEIKHIQKTPLMIRLGCISLAFIAVLVGCEPAEFENPLSDPRSAEVDENLIGVWTTAPDSVNGGGGYESIHFNQVGDKLLEVVWIDPDARPIVTVFKGFVTRIGDDTYLNVQFRIPRNLQKEEIEYRSGYYIVNYEVSADHILRLAYFDDHKAKTLIQEGKLEGKKMDLGTGETAIRVMSSTSKLVELIRVTKHGDLFIEHNEYHKSSPPSFANERN
jgi:hypothetical protein